MIPQPPPRRAQLGFLYFPPIRVQGLSVAGEETVVQIPELDVCFDIGRCPRAALTSNVVALSHGHMDHSAGLPYYFSQRHFQGMGTGTVACHEQVAKAIHGVMRAWTELEVGSTPYRVVPLRHEQELELKPRTFLRAIEVNHTVPALAFVVVERRSKLKAEFLDLPQSRIVELKQQGVEITQTHEAPIVAYTGDTLFGRHLLRDDMMNARILIAECTFTELGHKSRAAVGKHMHLDDVAQLVEASHAEAIVLVHLSRRTHMGLVQQRLDDVLPRAHRDRVHLLMDGRSNRARYEQQKRDAEAAEAARLAEAGRAAPAAPERE